MNQARSRCATIPSTPLRSRALLAAAAVAWSAAAYGQNTPPVIWDGGSVVDDKYVTPENWNPDTVPTNAANEFLQINDGSTALVETGDAAQGAFLMLGMKPGDSGHLNITGGTMTLGEFRVGGRETINTNLADWTLGTLAPNGGGTGAVTQTGGNVTINYTPGSEPPTQGFFVGDAGLTTGNTANGTYTISGSATLTSGINFSDVMVIGTGVGTIGAFNQADSSTVTSNGSVTIARRGAAGTYTMSGGTLNAKTSLYVGDGDTTGVQSTSGAFTQIDGDVNVFSNLEIGRRSGTGVYNMSKGTLDALILIVGGGPTNESVSARMHGDGTFNLQGTQSAVVTITSNADVGLTHRFSTGGDTEGRLNLSNPNGELKLTGSSADYSIGNGIGAIGIVTQSAGLTNITGASAQLFVGGEDGNGTLNLTGGTLNIKGALSEIAIGYSFGTGTMNIDGTGHVDARSIQVGGSGTSMSGGYGILNVDGGQLTAGNLSIPSGTRSGIINITDGVVNITTFKNTTESSFTLLPRSVNISGGTTAIGTLTGGGGVVWNVSGGNTTVTNPSSFSNSPSKPTIMNVSSGGAISFVGAGTSLALIRSTLNITGGTFNANSLSVGDDEGVLYISGGNVNIASGAFPGTLTLSSDATLKTDNAITLASNIFIGGELDTEVNANVNSGSLTLTGPLSIDDSTMAKTGSGTLTISGPQAHHTSALISIRDGSLNLDSNGGPSLKVSASGGTVNFGVAQTLSSIELYDGGTVNIGAHDVSLRLSSGAFRLVDGTANGTTGVISAPNYSVHRGTANAILGGAGKLTKSSVNVVTLTRVNGYTGGNAVNAGTLISTFGFKAGGPMTIAATAKAIVPAASPSTYDPGANVYPSGSDLTGSKVGSLAIANDGQPLGTRAYTGQLDLGNSDMVIDHAGTSPIDDVRDMLRAGFNEGAWDGQGIVSSVAQATEPSVFALGYAENAQLATPFGAALGGPAFFGQDVDATAVLVKFTWVGDLNLDGLVDSQDMSVFNTKWDNGATSGRYWSEGDFNYDGFLDFSDLSLFNTNYDPGKPSLPEPGVGVSMLGIFALGAARRTRRRG